MHPHIHTHHVIRENGMLSHPFRVLLELHSSVPLATKVLVRLKMSKCADVQDLCIGTRIVGFVVFLGLSNEAQDCQKVGFRWEGLGLVV